MFIFVWILAKQLEILYADRDRALSQIRRRLVKNFMDIIILSELKETPLSGYDVMTLIYSGSVYSLLYSMERKGLIKGDWNERRRLYTLTQKGEEAIEATTNSYDRIESFITDLLPR
jgi:DNA-binding PadR family transcriptional regulator